MDNELSFGADCVIRLQDLGQFKDYTDTIDALIDKLNHLKSSKKPLMCDELLQVIEADPQDTYFLPRFKHFLSLVVDQNWLSYDLQQNQRKSIFKFELTIIQQCLLSFTFSEEVLETMIKKCSNYVQIQTFQHLLLNILLELAQKVVYIDEYDAVVTLFNYLQEDKLFGSSPAELLNMRVAVYLQICDKLLRSHKIRKTINQRFIKDNFLFLCKLTLWNKQRTQFESYKKEIQSKNYYSSSFLQKALAILQNSSQL